MRSAWRSLRYLAETQLSRPRVSAFLPESANYCRRLSPDEAQQRSRSSRTRHAIATIMFELFTRLGCGVELPFCADRRSFAKARAWDRQGLTTRIVPSAVSPCPRSRGSCRPCPEHDFSALCYRVARLSARSVQSSEAGAQQGVSTKCILTYASFVRFARSAIKRRSARGPGKWGTRAYRSPECTRISLHTLQKSMARIQREEKAEERDAIQIPAEPRSSLNYPKYRPSGGRPVIQRRFAPTGACHLAFSPTHTQGPPCTN